MGIVQEEETGTPPGAAMVVLWEAVVVSSVACAMAKVQLLSAHCVRSMLPSSPARCTRWREGCAGPPRPSLGAAPRVELKQWLFEVFLSALMETITQTKTSCARARHG